MIHRVACHVVVGRMLLFSSSPSRVRIPGARRSRSDPDIGIDVRGRSACEVEVNGPEYLAATKKQTVLMSSGTAGCVHRRLRKGTRILLRRAEDGWLAGCGTDLSVSSLRALVPDGWANLERKERKDERVASKALPEWSRCSLSSVLDVYYRQTR